MSKKTFLTFMVFIIVFGFLGIPFIKWGFITDDFGNIFYSKIKAWSDFLKFFSQDTRVCLYPPNYIFGQASFFSVYYRPLIFVFYYLQSLIFGIYPYAFYLVTVGLHALNAVLLFSIVLGFSNYLMAFLAAMFFAFHSSLLNWFGWISAQQQQISLFFIFLIFIFLKKYLDTKKLIYYLFAVFFFILALFTREIILILPLVLFYFVYTYKAWPTQSFVSKVLYSFQTVSIFIIVNLSYLFLRLYLFPINFAVSGFNIYKFFLNLKNHWYEPFCIATDALDLTMLPPGHFYLKTFIFLFILGIFFWMFFYNKQKKWVCFFIVSFLMLLWFVIFSGYVSRYLYEVLPFFILAVAFLCRFCSKKIPIFLKVFGLSVLSFLIIINFCFLMFFLKHRELQFHFIENAYENFACSNNLNNSPIVCVGIPNVFANNIAPAIWLRDGKKDKQVFCDFTTASCIGSSVLTWFKRFYSYFEEFDENIVKVFRDKNCFYIKTLDPEKVFFGYGRVEEKQSFLGRIIINRIDEKNRVCELSLIVDEKWLLENPIFVSWDYKMQKFIILK